tara:strand:+ start:299 stop:682 length:384 start_codon:yes stop_codon:yes gene_type:complete
MIILYAVAISKKNVFVKCPFCVKQSMHKVENKRGLLNGIIEEAHIDCRFCKQNIIVVTDDTERIDLRPNKNNTSYLRNKHTLRRQECLYKIERAKYIFENNLTIDPIDADKFIIPCEYIDINIIDVD